MKRLVSTKDLSHEDWLEWRRKGIGGSDVSAIMGFNRWRGSVEVWLDKVAPIKTKESEPMYWGNILEDIVAQEFTKRTGYKVSRLYSIIQHDKHHFLIANIDRKLVGEKIGLECKTASAYKSSEWKDDEIPAEYILQCQHYMAVTGYRAWWIAVLIGGNQFEYKLIERDEEIIDLIIKKTAEFWEKYVIPQKMPPIEDIKSDTLKYLYPESNGELIKLSSDIDLMLQKRLILKKRLEETSEEIESIDKNIKSIMGENERGESKNFIVTWKSSKSKRVNTDRLKKEYPNLAEVLSEQNITRRFSIREIKGE